MGLGAAQPRQGEAVADFDALDRLGAHERPGEPCVEPFLLGRVGAEPRGNPVRAHLDDPAHAVAVGPRRVVMLGGNPVTRARLEAEGVDVWAYGGSEISLKGGGGPTCLTRPLARKGPQGH